MDDRCWTAELPGFLAVVWIVFDDLSLQVADQTYGKGIVPVAFNVMESSLQNRGVAANLLCAGVSTLLVLWVGFFHFEEMIERAKCALNC